MFKVTHVTMFVHDQDASLEFYKKLGFTVHTDASFDAMRWLTLNILGMLFFVISIFLSRSL